MSRLYSPSGNPTCGYRIEHTPYLKGNAGPTHWYRVWTEPGEEPEFGPVFAKQSEAYRDAAQNWRDCGSGSPRLPATLDAIATKLEKRGE